MAQCFVASAPALARARAGPVAQTAAPACVSAHRRQVAASGSGVARAELALEARRAFFGAVPRRFVAASSSGASAAASVRCSMATECIAAAAAHALPTELAASALTSALNSALAPIVVAGAGAAIIYLGKQIADEAIKKSNEAREKNDAIKIVQIVGILLLCLVLLKLV
eukprot:tig00020960_g16550.t1